MVGCTGKHLQLLLISYSTNVKNLNQLSNITLKAKFKKKINNE